MMRSLLYVPGHRIDYINNILNLNADAYTLDIEDSVPPSEKAKARSVIYDVLRYGLLGDRQIYIRLNSFSTGMTEEDLEAVVHDRITGVCLTKCNDAKEVKILDNMLYGLERERGISKGKVKIQLLIETAKGMMNIYSMAIASNRVTTLIFGAVDYTADVGIDFKQPIGVEYMWARQRVLCTSVAIGAVPIDCPYMNIRDEQGFTDDTTFSSSIGYRGRALVHPAQIRTANAIYSPSKATVLWAKEIKDVFEREALSKGKAAIEHKGKLVATAVYNSALNVLRYVDSQGVS